MEYFPDTFKALKILQKLEFELFVVTNQSGVGRGYFSLETVYVIHRQLQNDLRRHQLSPFKDFAVCPHSPGDQCICRKPSGKMILDLIEKHNINPEHSFMLGDKIIDAEAGMNAGVQGVIVRKKIEKGFPFFNTILEFASSIKK